MATQMNRVDSLPCCIVDKCKLKCAYRSSLFVHGLLTEDICTCYVVYRIIYACKYLKEHVWKVYTADVCVQLI